MSRPSLLVATSAAVHRLTGLAAGAPSAEMCFEGPDVRFVAGGRSLDVIALGGGELRVLRGHAAEALPGRANEPIECVRILSEDPLELLVGTEDARLYRWADGRCDRVESFDALACRNRWHTPWGGPPSVRSLAGADGWVYADIHVGSIMRSGDGGQTWEPVTPSLHEDVHQVNACPAAPERVYANTAAGPFVSDDRGMSWAHRAADLGDRYGRAIAAAPAEPDLVLATGSDGPHGDNVHGQLWRSEDAGRTWAHVAEGFPASTPKNINTHHVAFLADGAACALAGRAVHVGTDRARRWRRAWVAAVEPSMLAASTSG